MLENSNGILLLARACANLRVPVFGPHTNFKTILYNCHAGAKCRECD
jgi:hypothetical protein